jgi:hypothetical protein
MSDLERSDRPQSASSGVDSPLSATGDLSLTVLKAIELLRVVARAGRAIAAAAVWVEVL